MLKSNVLTYVTSFAVGAAAGATFALLNAPQSGKKTRSQLKRGVSDARYRTQRAISMTQERAMDTLDDIQGFVKEVGDEAVHQVERIKMAGQELVEKPKELLARANGK